MLKHALKEWAVICQALAEGRQALILRKGGLAEKAGDFQLEHTRFWLFPTYLHQEQAGIKPEAMPYLERSLAQRPASGAIRLTHFAEAAGLYKLHDMVGALAIRGLHLWSDETVQARFAYRQPGLYVVPLRVYRVPHVTELADAASYAGCHSWVELEREVPTEGAVPVLTATEFDDLRRQLDQLLHPTALA
jgi:hypothetical protein